MKKIIYLYLSICIIMLFSIGEAHKYLSIDNNTSDTEILTILEDEPIVFSDVPYSFGPNTLSVDSNNYGVLCNKYYFTDPDKKELVEGEIYRTIYDSDETIEQIKMNLYKKALNNELYRAPIYDEQDIYYGSFNIGSSFIPINNKTTVRTISCTYNGELLGMMTDYENIFVLNNPNNSNTLYLLVTHQTYLSPTQSNNRNYKGVGVELKLNKPSTSSITVVDYAPGTQAPSKTVSHSANFGLQIGDSNLNANIGYSYTKNVNSPSISSKGTIGEGIVDICFEYIEPGSWYGDFCKYNSSETFQCSLVVMQAPKSSNVVNYNSSVTGRFQKYQNWPFPWVDEYYTINLDKSLNTSDLLTIINNN